jgi:hypothetical protein
MSSVTHLTQYLLRVEPAKNMARLALYNYLKVFTEGSTPLTADVLNRFFAYILNFQFWPSNTKLLGESIKQDLLTFSQNARLDFELEQIYFPHQRQVLRLEQDADFIKLVEKREKQLASPDDRLKIIPISELQTLALSLKKAGRLEVRVYGRGCWILNGNLELLEPMSELNYSSGLELLPHFPQLLECPLATTARFQVVESGTQGVMVRGHLLQKYETLNGGAVHSKSELLYVLKRIERHFIDPLTDPYYRELVNQLDRAAQQAKNPQPEAQKLASATLQKGKNALKQIFPNDKQLTVLVTNLEYSLLKSDQSAWTPEQNR